MWKLTWDEVLVSRGASSDTIIKERPYVETSTFSSKRKAKKFIKENRLWRTLYSLEKEPKNK